MRHYSESNFNEIMLIGNYINVYSLYIKNGFTETNKPSSFFKLLFFTKNVTIMILSQNWTWGADGKSSSKTILYEYSNFHVQLKDLDSAVIALGWSSRCAGHTEIPTQF